MSTIEEQLVAVTRERDELEARITETLVAIAWHRVREGSGVEVRGPRGTWVDVADLLARNEPSIQWGTVHEVSSTRDVCEPAESESAARAKVRESREDTGLVARAVTADGVPLGDWHPVR